MTYLDMNNYNERKVYDLNEKENQFKEYICYCNKVTEQDIIIAIQNGASTIEDVIKVTGAMKNSNCKVNNPKGTCCYIDIVKVYNEHR